MSDSDQDEEFQAYLKRRARMDKGVGSGERLEPPPELDRIIIGKARKAIEDASPVRLYRAPGWALPVGLAATLLLSFAILLDLGVRARRKEVMAQAPPAPVAQAMVAERSGGRPSGSEGAGGAPSGPATDSASTPAVPPVATAPWPPSFADAPPRLVSSETGGHRSSGGAAAENGRERFSRLEAAAKRSRDKGEAEPAVFAAAPAAKAVAFMAQSAPLDPVDLSITMDLSSTLASTASSARAAIEGAFNKPGSPSRCPRPCPTNDRGSQ
jgi:hypothetical protein